MKKRLFLIIISFYLVNCKLFDFWHKKEETTRTTEETATEPNVTTEAEPKDENSVPKSTEILPKTRKFSLTPFYIGCFITTGLFLLIIIALAILLMPTGRFCDNFLRKPGQLPYKLRKRERKRAWKESKKAEKEIVKKIKEKKKEKRKEEMKIRKSEKQEQKELERINKEKWAEKKRREREREMLTKKREKAKQELFLVKMKEQERLEDTLKVKVLERELAEKDVFSRIEKGLKVKSEAFKEPDNTKFHVRPTPKTQVLTCVKVDSDEKSDSNEESDSNEKSDSNEMV